MQMIEAPSAVLPWIIRGKVLAAKTSRDSALDWMVGNRAPAAAVSHIRAAVGAAGTHDPGYQSAVLAFFESTRTSSAFFRLLFDRAFRVIPMYKRIAITTIPATAAQIGEGKAKPLSRLAQTYVTLLPMKAIAQTVITNELLFDVGSAGQTAFHRELVNACSVAVDGVFLPSLVDTGTTSTPSAGPTAANAWKDLRTALLSLNLGEASKPYWISAPNVAVMAATLADSAGGAAFGGAMTPQGGELCGQPCIVSSGVPAGELFLVDAARLAANGDTIAVRETTEGDMLMQDGSPPMSSATPTGSTMTSMWQTNSTGLQCDAIFGVQKFADDAVSVVTGINWGGGP